jgi:hypothetical protein
MVKFFEIITTKLSFGFKIQSGLINLHQLQKESPDPQGIRAFRK